MLPGEQNCPKLRTTDQNSQIGTRLVGAPFSVTRFAHTCRTRSGFSSFYYSHPLLTLLRHSDSSLSLETASGLSSFVCAKASAPPQAGCWPNLPQPGWVGVAGVMSLCLPRKGETKDGVPKDKQPHPKPGCRVDFFPLPFSPSCLRSVCCSRRGPL